MKIWKNFGKTMINCLRASQVSCTLCLCLQLKLSTHSQTTLSLSFFPSVNRENDKKEHKQWPKLLNLNVWGNAYPLRCWWGGRTDEVLHTTVLMIRSSQSEEEKMCVRSSASLWQQRQSSSERLSLLPSLTPFLSCTLLLLSVSTS